MEIYIKQGQIYEIRGHKNLIWLTFNPILNGRSCETYPSSRMFYADARRHNDRSNCLPLVSYHLPLPSRVVTATLGYLSIEDIFHPAETIN